MICKDLKSLEKELTVRIQKALVQNVVPVVKENISDAIETEVYDHYPSPKYPDIYQRRRNNGGLSDIDNMVSTINGLTLSIKNETPFNTDYGGISYLGGIGLDELIVFGDGYKGVHYDYTNSNGSNAYKDPRDFYSKCVTNLETNKEHVIALKKGLKIQGLEVV